MHAQFSFVHLIFANNGIMVILSLPPSDHGVNKNHTDEKLLGPNRDGNRLGEQWVGSEVASCACGKLPSPHYIQGVEPTKSIDTIDYVQVNNDV